MRVIYLVFLFVTSYARAEEVTVRPDAAVITLSAPCTNPTHDSSDSSADSSAQRSSERAKNCNIIITRAKFDQLVAALQSDMPPEKYLTVANAYIHNLRMAQEAERRGIDASVRFEQQMHYARQQLLAQDLNLTLQQEANDISDADLRAYYDAHHAALEVATLERIVVPYSARGSADADAMSRLAEVLRLRCLHGETSDSLQRAANAAAGIDDSQVQTRLNQVRRSSLTPSHEVVMALQPGAVSAVISDPEGAHFIYRMRDKKIAAFDDVKTEIHNTIAAQRYRDSMKKFEGDVVFSDAYFNPQTTNSPVSGGHGRRAQSAISAVPSAVKSEVSTAASNIAPSEVVNASQR